MLYPNTPNRTASITLVEGKVRTRIPVQDILFIQSEHIYVRIFLRDGRKILYRSALRDIIRQLPSTSFLQVHRSYIVNLRWIDNHNGNSIAVAQHLLPVSRTYRKILRTTLRNPLQLSVQNRSTAWQYKAG
ncbi:MAG: LytTR family DNA-binding domain-containing protein [Bacteroidota bacterium]